jgi:hypothetical protein
MTRVSVEMWRGVPMGTVGLTFDSFTSSLTLFTLVFCVGVAAYTQFISRKQNAQIPRKARLRQPLPPPPGDDESVHRANQDDDQPPTD